MKKLARGTAITTLLSDLSQVVHAKLLYSAMLITLTWSASLQAAVIPDDFYILYSGLYDGLNANQNGPTFC